MGDNIMNKNKQSARKVQWIDVSGQRMQLEPSVGGELLVEVEYGAVTIRADNCRLTTSPGSGQPDFIVALQELNITISMMNCRIDWKKE